MDSVISATNKQSEKQFCNLGREKANWCHIPQTNTNTYTSDC